MTRPFTLFALVALSTPGVAQYEVEKLLAPGGDANDRFGGAVAFRGDTLVVGAERALPGQPGRAYVYTRTSSGWVESQVLDNPNPSINEKFGGAVAFNGERILVGVEGDKDLGPNVGSVSVYVDDQGTWVEEARLFPPLPVSGQLFGRVVDVSGDRAVVSATRHNSTFHPVFVFLRNANGWHIEDILFPPTGGGSDFGASLDLAGDRLLVGAPGGFGATYLFERSGHDWIETERFEITGTTSATRHGTSVALVNDRVFAGAPGDAGSSGTVRVYRDTGAGWVEEAALSPVGASINWGFGATLASDGERLLSGAVNFAWQRAYLFRRTGNTWSVGEPIVASDGTDVGFGNSLDLAGETAIAGSPEADDLGPNSGAAYVLRVVEPIGTSYCTANANSTGQAASIAAHGFLDLASDFVALTGSQVPEDEFGYFLMSETQGFVPFFGMSEGNLCLGAPIVRFSGDVLVADVTETMRLVLDLGDLPQGVVFQPGETWNFQLWFRDGQTSNTSDAVELSF